jgi:hypothetical protein
MTLVTPNGGTIDSEPQGSNKLSLFSPRRVEKLGAELAGLDPATNSLSSLRAGLKNSVRNWRGSTPQQTLSLLSAPG